MLKLPFSAKSTLAALMILAISVRGPLAAEFREPPGMHPPGTPFDPHRPYAPTPAPGPAIPGAVAEMVRVPSITGDTPAQAEQVAGSAHLALRRGNAVQNADDTVIRQEPEAGRMVSPGSAVEAWFEAAPRREATVPPIVGKTRAQAERDVVAAHLTLRQGNAEPNADATVIHQAPEAGTIVAPGSAVEVSFAVAPAVEQTVVPTVAPAGQATVPTNSDRAPPQGEQAAADAPHRIPAGNAQPNGDAKQSGPPPAAGTGSGPSDGGSDAAAWSACVLALLVLAALVAYYRSKHRRRLRVTVRKDPGTQWIASQGDPVGPVLGLRVRQANPVVTLSWAGSKETLNA